MIKFRYLGDEYGSVSVLKYDAEEGNLLQLPYYVPTNIIAGIVIFLLLVDIVWVNMNSLEIFRHKKF